jgi:hypothetical protein
MGASRHKDVSDYQDRRELRTVKLLARCVNLRRPFAWDAQPKANSLRQVGKRR